MNDWSDKPTIIIGSGPSLSDVDRRLVAAVRNSIHLLVVNDNWQLFPEADALYAADFKWWLHYAERIVERFHGQMWSWDEGLKKTFLDMRIVHGEIGFGAPNPRDHIMLGTNSGLQAIQLAYIWKSPLTVLLGFDAMGTRGAQHWFGEHPAQLDQGLLPYDAWQGEAMILARELLANNFTVINSSPMTSYTCFPRLPLVDVLALIGCGWVIPT